MNLIRTLSNQKSARLSVHGIGLAIVALVTIPLYLMGNLQSRTDFLAQTNQADEIKSELKNEDLLRAKYRELSKQLQDLNPSNEIKRELRKRPRDAEFLVEISEAAKSCGIRIENFSRGKVVELPAAAFLKVSIQFKSDFGAICRFFQTVENLDFASQVQTLSITSSSEQELQNVNVSFELYFNPDAQNKNPTSEAFAFNN